MKSTPKSTPRLPRHLAAPSIRAATAAAVAVACLACGGGGPAAPEALPELHRAARQGDVARLRAALRAGADPDARDAQGRTAIVLASQRGQAEAVEALVAAGADLDRATRGTGTALEAAEREGHADVAAALLRAGARSSGKSVGDVVCVRPWGGEGYCGTVEALDRTDIHIRVTELVGCAAGCAPRGACSDGRPVGGEGGLRPGAVVDTDLSCVTQTGVSR